MAFEVTKNTLIGDILDEDRTTAPYFLEMGMHCLGWLLTFWKWACTALAVLLPEESPLSRHVQYTV